MTSSGRSPMIPILGLLFLIASGCSFDFKSTYTLSGRVVDQNGNGLEGVTVQLKQGPSTITGEDGKWQLTQLAGTVTVQFEQEGWGFSPPKKTVNRNSKTLRITGVKNPIEIQDKGLERAIREAIDKPEGLLSKQDVRHLTTLNAKGYNIRSLRGIRFVSSLKRLNLKNNRIQDASPLRHLSSLTYLNISRNQISDVSWVISLNNLTFLYGNRNEIRNLRPVSSLNGLQKLVLRNNAIRSLLPLSDLSKLRRLNVSGNQIDGIPSLNSLFSLVYLNITDNPVLRDRKRGHFSRVINGLKSQGCTIKPRIVFIPDTRLERVLRDQINKPEEVLTQSDLSSIAELDASNQGIYSLKGIQHATNLRRLDLSGNRIQELHPLSELTKLRFLDLRGNQLTSIRGLFERPIERLSVLDFNHFVQESRRFSLSPLKNLLVPGQNQDPSSPPLGPERLVHLNLGDNPLTSVKGITNASSLKRLYLDGTQLSSLDPVRRLTSLDYLHLGGYSPEKWKPENVSPREKNQLISSETLVSGRTVSFRDGNLEEALKKEYFSGGANAASEGISARKAARVRSLDLSGYSISSLEGLQYFTGLQTLNLKNNQITDLAPLSNLTQLEQLNLDNNQLKSLHGVERLRSLRTLRANYNRISTISPLAQLNSLSRLELAFNEISSIQPISTISSLSYLDLGANEITGVQSLSRLDHLKRLHLWGNEIRSVKPLGEISSLRVLNLNQNYVETLRPLHDLLHLHTLHANQNWIRTIQSTPSMSSLQHLSISGNKLNASSMDHMQVIRKLKQMGVRVKY